MKSIWLRLPALALVLPLAWAASPAGKVETTGACTLPSVSDAMRSELAPAGVRVVTDSGPLCEVWLRKSIPQKSAGKDYGTIAPGTFVGVINYLSNGGDFRGQSVKKGAYVMRYINIPSDGNHLGVSPNPEFFILSPPGDDKDPKAMPVFDEMVRMSKLAAGTNHPHPLLLDPPKGTAPAWRMTDDGHGVLETKAGDLPVAITLIGKAEG